MAFLMIEAFLLHFDTNFHHSMFCIANQDIGFECNKLLLARFNNIVGVGTAFKFVNKEKLSIGITFEVIKNLKRRE